MQYGVATVNCSTFEGTPRVLCSYCDSSSQTCQVVRISRILYENSFKIREYDFYLQNTDFERLKKEINKIAIYSI